MADTEPDCIRSDRLRFQENILWMHSSPVVDDVTVRFAIANMIVQGWEIDALDVSTPFLHGKTFI
jgi:hypothetical protein